MTFNPYSSWSDRWRMSLKRLCSLLDSLFSRSLTWSVLTCDHLTKFNKSLINVPLSIGLSLQLPHLTSYPPTHPHKNQRKQQRPWWLVLILARWLVYTQYWNSGRGSRHCCKHHTPSSSHHQIISHPNCLFQNEKEQILTTNVWLNLVSALMSQRRGVWLSLI